MADPVQARPTKARYIVVLWLCGLAGILYLDRICMAQAMRPIRDDLALSNAQASAVAMAFTLAYGLFAVPIGWMGDRLGPRSVLTWIVVLWSAFTGLTGLAYGLAALLIVRFCFGAAEAGAFPMAARVMACWFPVSERGRVQGIMLASAQVGAVIAPAAAAYLIEEAGWRWAFGAFALIGFVWAAGFWVWFRDDPARHSQVGPDELATIRADATPADNDPGPVPWRAVFANRGILVLGLIMVFGAFYSYFFYTWFPAYLQLARGVSNVHAGWLASLVIAGSAVGMLLGGWLADRIPAWTADPVRARRRLGVVSYLIAAVCLFAGVRCDDSLALAILWGASFCAMHITLPNWWSVVIPQSGRHVGTLFGLMNGVGVFGAMASQGFVGVFADWQAARGLKGREQWDPIFDVYVVILLGGALGWWLYRYVPLVGTEPTPQTEPQPVSPMTQPDPPQPQGIQDPSRIQR